MSARRASAAVFGAFIGAWLSRAVFKWVLDVDGTLLWVLIGAGAVVVSVLAVAGEIEREER
jgi:hypothetical protein